jgi:hypothetical protein
MADESQTPDGEAPAPEAVTAETPDSSETTSAVDAVAADASTPKSLADVSEDAEDFDLSTLGDAYLDGDKPNMAKIAEALSRVPADVPAEGETYDLAFPDDFDLKDPDGKVVQLDPEDPAVAKFTEIATKHNMGKGAVSDLMSVYGDILKTIHTANTESVEANRTAEFAKLDTDPAKAEERAITAARGLINQVPQDKRSAIRPLIDQLTTAETIIAVETLLEVFAGEGAASPSTDGKAKKKSFAERIYE